MASSDQTRKQLILLPHEAGFLDTFRVLFTSDLESKQFIDTVKKNEKLLEQRVIIFSSLLVQKALQISSKPLQSLRSTLEMWLNLLDSNNNFSTLVVNLFHGNVVKPNENLASFKSTIGCLDERVELDKNIKPGDKKYFVALSAMASKIAYENKAFIKETVENRWKMKLLGDGAYDFWNDDQEKFSTQGFLFHDKTANHNMIIVAFRGTEPFDADSWCSDFDISWYKFQGVAGKVHGGFMKALGLQKGGIWRGETGLGKDFPTAYHTIRDELRNIFEIDDETKFIVTGHSLGGALAVLFPAVLAMLKEDKILARLEAVYTFGQPRVGDNKFGVFMTDLFRRYGVKYYRFVYSHDIVPRVPYDNSTLTFKHFGTCVYYNSLYEGKILPEAPEKNYFCLTSFITKRLDALWEIVRSFILPYMYGSDYKEGCLLRMVRVLGWALFPGVLNHGPQEYINAVQLGNDDIFD